MDFSHTDQVFTIAFYKKKSTVFDLQRNVNFFLTIINQNDTEGTAHKTFTVVDCNSDI